MLTSTEIREALESGSLTKRELSEILADHETDLTRETWIGHYMTRSKANLVALAGLLLQKLENAR